MIGLLPVLPSVLGCRHLRTCRGRPWQSSTPPSSSERTVVANTGINAVCPQTTKPSLMQMAELATGGREREEGRGRSQKSNEEDVHAPNVWHILPHQFDVIVMGYVGIENREGKSSAFGVPLVKSLAKENVSEQDNLSRLLLPTFMATDGFFRPS